MCRDQRLPSGRGRSEGLCQRRQGLGGGADRPLRLRSEQHHDAARLAGDEAARAGRDRQAARRCQEGRRARVHQQLARHVRRRHRR